MKYSFVGFNSFFCGVTGPKKEKGVYPGDIDDE
jgi:hypothetical protein